jgi:hypothetical protein
MNRRLICCTLALVGVLLAAPLPATAQTSTPAIRISQLLTGWASDTVAIPAPAPIINPHGCATTDLYVTTITSPGYRTHLAALLLAFGSNRSVVLVIDDNNCELYRPRIIGVAVQAQ